MKVEVTIEGTEELLRAFGKVQRGIVDLRQLGTWDAVAAVFYKIVYGQFASEGADGKSGSWKKLSPKYEAAKFRKWGQVPILQASGRLWRSLTQKGAKDSVYAAKAMELTIGSSVEYGGYHQSRKPRTRLPRRPPLDFTEDHEKQLAKPIQQKLRQLIENARLADTRGF